ncbi:MAG TPA: beta-ketoacyl-[acyl-carrier-protein] synthase family protein [Bacteroidales bacterium]|nr:beta-ketoacyl-[acyl-carrier-protein] synthase family protein [Bacteroidales bacterium]
MNHTYKKRRTVVTSFALMTPWGNDKNLIWSMLTAGKSSVREWPDLKEEGFRFTKACRIADDKTISSLARGSWLAKTTLHNALAGSSVSFPDHTGIFIGSTLGESGAFEAMAGGAELNPADYTVNSFARLIQKELGLKGPSFSYGTACAAGNYALGAAASYISNGHADVAIAGGIEPFSRVAMTGFSRSRAMTTNICRPFDRNRDGMMLGEGAAVFILEEEEHALQRGAKPLAIIGALGLSCDAYHQTAPLPDGTGIIQAMTTALTIEDVDARKVDWICAHGSGTMASDNAEALAINTVFGADVPVSGIKGALGHSLGASTAIETAVCIMALQHNVIPPTANLEEPDPQFAIDLVRASRQKELNYILNCGYAFGGLNSALFIKKWK